MTRRHRLFAGVYGALLSLSLNACGGGGGGGSTPTPVPVPQVVTISGTVATATALAGTVSVYDSSAKSQPVSAGTEIGSAGTYSVAVTGFTLPFLLEATGQAGGQGPTVTLYAVATAAGTVNITPVTTVMALNAAAGNVQTLMTGSARSLPSLTAADLVTQNANMDTLFSGILTAQGLSAKYDFTSTAFAVGDAGYSKLLNTVSVNLTSRAAVVITDTASPATPTTIDTMAGSPNGGLDVISGPTTVVGAVTVGGTISGLTGSGLQLQDNGADVLSVAPNATSFTFATPVASGAAYAVAVKTQPSGQSCVVGNGTGTVTNSNVTSVTLICTANRTPTYAVSGTISGLTASPLVLELNGGSDLTLGAGATTFSFAAALKPSSTYQVTVKTTPAGQVTCSVANGSGTITNANIMNVAVTCSTFYTFSGTVSDLKGATLTLLLQTSGGYSSNAVTVLPGQTSFSFGVGVPNGTGFTVTVQQQPSGQTCTVANGSGSVTGSNVTSIGVSCATVPQWAWINGDDSALSPVFGTLGQGATGNTPGSRRYSATWSDAQGRLWLFGGSLDLYDPGTVGNDLWMFNRSTGLWTWMSGSKTANASGIYGTQGTAASSNVPGARTESATWTDANGNLWLFGGAGFDSQGTQDLLNDLWKYDTEAKQWTWVSGDNLVDNVGVYGTVGVSAAANVPSSRSIAATWIDKSGNLWLFGGGACCALVDNIYQYYDLNDLWRFNPALGQWTWMGGSQMPNAAGVFGIQGVSAAANTPHARHGAQVWTDATGSFWLFGGQESKFSNSLSATSDLSNDLWKYDTTINQWTWMGGPETPNDAGSYGTQGVAAATNVPGARAAANAWIDLSGTFWLFGGFSTNTSYIIQNDLWKYDPAGMEWTWVSGTNEDNPGLYQVQGLPAAGNIPGARAEGMSWTDASGFWLYGGYAASPLQSGAFSIYQGGTNDLWHFGPAIFYNGTGSMTGTFTDQSGCKYTAAITIANANVTLSAPSSGAVTITYTVPAYVPQASSASTCAAYQANGGAFSIPVSVNGTVMQSLPGSIGSVAATITGGVVSGTVGFQETGAQGSGTFSWTESGSFSTVATQVTVPNLVGLSEAAAASVIANDGLWLNTITHQSSDTVAAGEVISQSIAANSSAGTGATVGLVVSSGPAPGSVPNVVGLLQSAAQTVIAAAGFQVGSISLQTSATVASGIVISEAPPAGSTFAPGSLVSLVVSSGVGTISEPNVTGLTQAAATAAISAANLSVGSVTTASSTSVVAGNVVSQSPPAGARLGSKSTVNLVVSSGSPNLLLGPAGANAIASASDFDGGDTLEANEVVTDPTLGPVVLVHLELDIADNATVGDVNSDIGAVGGTIVSMLEGTGLLVIRIPNPGTVTQLQAVAAQFASDKKAFDGVRIVGPATPPDQLPPNALPLPSQPPTSTNFNYLDLAAARAPAAWNAAGAVELPGSFAPNVAILDSLGTGGFGSGIAANLISGEIFNANKTSSHGIGVFSRVLADFGASDTSRRNEMAAIAPFTSASRAPAIVVDLTEPDLQGINVDFANRSAPQAWDSLIVLIKATTGRVVLNTSLGYLGHCAEVPERCNDAYIKKETPYWIRRLRSKRNWSTPGDLEEKVIQFTSAGNNGMPEAQSNSPYAAAALRTDLTTTGGVSIQPLVNTIVVESVGVIAGDGATTAPTPACLSSFSTSAYTAPAATIKNAISAFGNNVLVATDGGSGSGYMSGTSFSTPQAASLAVYLWDLSPILSVQEVKGRIIGASKNTAQACVPAPRPTIDAYATILSADTHAAIVVQGTPQTQAPARLAILDIVNESGQPMSDGKFDAADLAAWVDVLTSATGTLDYSRYDLNGDGFTGGSKSVPFDLDASYDGTAPYSTVINKTVMQTVAGIAIPFKENAVTDAQILCYYAYSNLYTQKNNAIDERPIILAPIASQCGLKLSQVNVTFSTIPSGWTNATPTTVQGFDSPPLSTSDFLRQGDPGCGLNGEPVSGEQGTGPQGIGLQFSKQVPASAYLLASHWINATPFVTAYRPTVTPCSSFVAVQGRQMWLNATTAFFDFSTQLYNESQSRVYSGTPDASGAFVGGYVDFGYTLFGEFEDTLKLSQAPMSTVQFIYIAAP